MKEESANSSMNAGPAWRVNGEPLSVPIIPFALTVTRANGWCRLALEGELDLATASAVAVELDRLERRRPRLLLVDLSGLTFMDLTGMRVLLGAHERARGRGYELGIIHVPPIVERLFELAGVDGVLNLIDDPLLARPAPS